MNTKIILVTGANRGIGFEICRQLDGLGHRVILGSRDINKGLEASGSLSSRVKVVQLDVSSEPSLTAAAKQIQEEFGYIDVLINNAGIGAFEANTDKPGRSGLKKFAAEYLGGVRKVAKPLFPLFRKAGILGRRPTVSDISLQQSRTLMETNFYGCWRMIQLFKPLLLKSKDAGIINMSSGMGALQGMRGDYPDYRISKAALNALTIMFASEFEKNRIRVNAMCPGWVKTDMGGPDAPRTVSEGADTAVWLATAPDLPSGQFFRDRKVIAW